MSLIEGFENRYVDVYRKSRAEDEYGGNDVTESVVISNLICKIDYSSGSYNRTLPGAQARSNNLLFCDGATDIRVGDILKNVRDICTTEVDQVDSNGTLVEATYKVDWVSNPGSEDDHLEVLLFRLDGLELS